MRDLSVWAKLAKRAKRQAKRRAQLAIIASALGFASWCVWDAGNVATPSAFAYEESSERGLIPESLKPKALTNYKAFIVGASDYQDDAVSDLKGVKNDVKALKKRLLEIGFEEKNIAVLLDGGDSASMPTKKIIERRFDEFVANLQEGDNVVVYLSGHGVQKGKGKEAETFFVPMDVDPGSDAKTFATSVSVEKMTDKLAKNEAARFRLVIVDACREKLGKSMSNEVGGAPRIATMIDAPKSVSVLYSCEPDKLSFEDDEADEDGVRHGFFTRGLLDALDVNDNKGDVDNDGKLTFLEFVKYVSERTESLASAQGKKQKPRHRFADESGDFVFLSDLLVDGLTRAKWNEAEKLYRDALKLKAAEKWSEALQKIRDARKINPKRPEYKATEKDIETFVKLAGLGGGGGAPPGGGSTGGGTGGGTSSGSGWLPFALFALTGGAACVAWLGWRKFELSRAIIGAFAPRTDVVRDARDAKRALRRQRKILDRTRKETRILENIAKTREETRNLEKATEAERKAQEAATANVVGASSSSSGYAPSDVAVAPRPFESTPRSTFAEPVAPVLPPSERDGERWEEERKKEEEERFQAWEETWGEPNRENEAEAARQAEAKRQAELKAQEAADKKLKEAQKTSAKSVVSESSAPVVAEPIVPRVVGGFSSASRGVEASSKKPGARKIFVVKGIEFAFRNCPAGSFTMGSPEFERKGLPGAELEGPTREVTLEKNYYLLETPVTQAMWRAILGTNPSWFSSSGGGSTLVRGMNTDDFPVENVSWEDCQTFIRKLNALAAAKLPSGYFFRLPSEAEWERAARAGTASAYFWGDALNGDRANCDGRRPYGDAATGTYLARTSDVRDYQENAWGLRDMSGNVREWCADWMGGYDAASLRNPTGATMGTMRTLRGGAWSAAAADCRLAARIGDVPTARSAAYGFRLAFGRKIWR